MEESALVVGVLPSKGPRPIFFREEQLFFFSISKPAVSGSLLICYPKCSVGSNLKEFDSIQADMDKFNELLLL